MNWVSSIWLFASMWYQCYSHVHVSFYINIVKCKLSIPIMWTSFIHMFQFHPSHLLSLGLSISSRGWDSNIWSNSIHVKIRRKATSSTIWPNFIHVIKFIQMYHPCSQNFHGFHPSHLIFISRLIPYWHQCHACGKTQFPVKFIQYPLSRKWSALLFFLFFKTMDNAILKLQLYSKRRVFRQNGVSKIPWRAYWNPNRPAPPRARSMAGMHLRSTAEINASVCAIQNISWCFPTSLPLEALFSIATL
jgi:hypothetical protein